MLNALLLVEEGGSFAFSSFPHSGFCWSYPSSNVNTFLSSSTSYKLAVGSRSLIRLWFAFLGQDCITCSVVHFRQMAHNVWRCLLWCQWPWAIILGFWKMLGFKFCLFLIYWVESFLHQLFGYLEVQFVYILAWVSQEAKAWNVGFIGEHGPRERSEVLGRRESQFKGASPSRLLLQASDWLTLQGLISEKWYRLSLRIIHPGGKGKNIYLSAFIPHRWKVRPWNINSTSLRGGVCLGTKFLWIPHAGINRETGVGGTRWGSFTLFLHEAE